MSKLDQLIEVFRQHATNQAFPDATQLYERICFCKTEIEQHAHPEEQAQELQELYDRYIVKLGQRAVGGKIKVRLKLSYVVPLAGQGISPEAQKKLAAAKKVIKPDLGDSILSIFCISPEERQAIWTLAGLTPPNYLTQTAYVDVEIPAPPTVMHAIRGEVLGLDDQPLKPKYGILQADGTVVLQDEPTEFKLTWDPVATRMKPVPKKKRKPKTKEA